MRPPVVIGGVPGSGTRVVARIVERAGVFLGTNRTSAEDAVEFWDLYDRWINRYLLREEVPLCTEELDLMSQDLSRCVRRHLKVIPVCDAPWGWKNPRSMLLLPFLNEHFPEMRFIHVVRDGRDMAFSENQHDVKRHGPSVLRNYLKDAPQPLKAAAIWARSNSTAYDFGTGCMPTRFLVMKYETLCEEPAAAIQRIFDFVGTANTEASQLAKQFVCVPSTIGRWRTVPDEGLRAAVEAHTCDALKKFGYF